MRARLVGIAGICAGMTFDIDGEESTSVGRSSQNRVRLDDRSVSREHCRIECREGRFVIRDLGSYRGTLVNDKTVSEHTLEHGDRVVLGASVFLFVTDAAAPPPETSVEFEEDAVSTELRLSATEAVYANPQLSANVPASARAAHDLGILLSIASRIGVIRDEPSLFWQLLGMLFEVVPGERGAILLVGSGGEFVPAAAWNRTSREVESVPVCRTVLRQVSEERSGLVVRNVAADEKLRKVESARKSQAFSIL